MTNKVLALLPTLNQRELREVSAAVEHLLEKGGETNAVYEGVLAVVGVKIPFSKFVRTKVGRHWAGHEKQFTAFIDAGQFKTSNKVVRKSLITYLLQLLADDLKKRKLPVSVATLALNLGEISRVFDDNFPGYRDNNMAQAVLEAMVQ